MLLQHIMFGWACLALFFVLVAIGSLFARRVAGKQTKEIAIAIFDFSAGQAEGRQMQRVLTEALSGAATDAEFERRFKAAICAATGLEVEDSWAWLGRSLMEYRQANEFDPSPRQLAERFLADIPRRYKFKEITPNLT